MTPPVTTAAAGSGASPGRSAGDRRDRPGRDNQEDDGALSPGREPDEVTRGHRTVRSEAASRHRTHTDPSPAGPQPRDRPRITVELAVSGPVNDRMAWTQTRATIRPPCPASRCRPRPALGPEVTANAVLASPEHRRKASLRSSLMIPAVALVDPQLTVSCPPPVTAASGLDVLNPVPGAAGLPPGQPADRRAGGRGAAPRGRGPAGRLRRRRGPGGAGGYGRLRPAGRDIAGQRQARRGAQPGRRTRRHRRPCRTVSPAPRCSRLVIETNVRALRRGRPASLPLTATTAARLLTGQPAASIQDGLT